MMTNATPVAPDSTRGAAAERENLTGNMRTLSLVLSVLAFSAPLVTVAGYLVFVIAPVGESAPVAWIIATVVLLIFSVGYTTMTRHVPRPGAFYAYISAAFGRTPGVGGAYLATLSYILIAAGLYVFAGITVTGLISGLGGPSTPWWLWTLVALIGVNFLGYMNVDLSARVLVVVMMIEVLIVVIFDVVVMVRGGAEGLSFAPINVASFINPGAGVALLIAFGNFLGFEATALYRDEVRNPNKTVPRATYISAIFIGLLYAVSGYALITAYGSGAVAAAQNNPSEMFALAINKFVLPGSSAFVNIVVATSAFASLLAVHNVASRYMYNLGVDRALPSFLGKVNPRHKSPSRASMAVGTIILILLVAVAGPFVVANSDPSVLIGAGSGVGSAGVLILMAIVSLAVIVWFARTGVPSKENAWKVFIAPAIAFLSLAAMVTFGLVRFDLLVGGTPGEFTWLIAVLLGVFAAGCAVALYLRSNKSEIYALLGRRDRTIDEERLEAEITTTP
ncbi:APC family permease [Microbacterium sp. 22303]|uniref:APC family permease n=1 Tax=Microbacterium sp. 22303 TaxID=3453905 RepID=UPI003F83634D